jgi:integrase
MIDTRIDGKRHRKFFRTKRDAEQELTRIKTKMAREGEEALSLPDDLRIAALAIQRDLEPFGKTLRDAGAFYLKFLNDSLHSITVRALVDEYLKVKSTKNLSEVHLRDLRNRYEVFCRTFGDSMVRTLTPRQIESWLNGLGLSNQSVKNFRSRIGGLMAFGVKREYLDRNPILAIDAPKIIGGAIEILSVDQLRSLLNAAPADMLPLIAIGAFAGVRSAELVRLEWSDLDIPRGFVTVQAARAKTARRRTIEMECCLQAWLAPFVGRTGRIFDNDAAELAERFNQKLNAIAREAGIPKWPNNGLRHSFASYHMAKYQDAESLRADLGHTSAKLIFSNYRELVHPDEAERYFKISPTAPAENVVPMSS